jgi:hypothetical protein
MRYHSEEDRIKNFWSYVQKTEDCWLWLGSIHEKTGHGQFCWKGKTAWAHRIAYLLLKGEIPSGFDLHHGPDCSDCCVNPDHLTPMSHGEHSRLTRKMRSGNGRNRRASIL